LPAGPASGASPATDLGTKNGDAAVSELTAEEGAVLFKNDNRAASATPALPILPADTADPGSILVTGPGAEYLIATPSREASLGFPDRISINPLQQLEDFSGNPSAFTYVPALGPTGEPVPPAALSTSNTSVTGNLSRTTGPGSPTTDATLDFTTASGNGQLAAGSYTWTGYVYVPTMDTYTFRFQFSPSVSSSNVTFSLDGTPKTLAAASTFYHGQYQGTVVVNPTNGGYTEKGLTNQQVAAASV